MRGQETWQSPFPRPGPALRGLLIVFAVVGIASAALVNWAGQEAWWIKLALDPDAPAWELAYRVFTAGFLTNPSSAGSLFFTLIGLYFLSPDLERRWGSARFLRFVVLSLVVGFGLALAVNRLPFQHPIFHPRLLFGPEAALVAVAIAWSLANAHLQVRLFMIVPVTGRVLLWVTIGMCALGFVYRGLGPEGAFAPWGGVLTGLLLGGSPSPLRSLYLRLKLAWLRRQSGDAGDEAGVRPRSGRKSRGNAPPLRVVYGGLEDELKKRKPPKDKRYLN